MRRALTGDRIHGAFADVAQGACVSIAIFEEAIDDGSVRVYAAFVELTTHQNRSAGVARSTSCCRAALADHGP